MDVAEATVTEEAPRMRLRHDLVFAEVPTGTLIRHSDGGFVLRGKSIYQWITTLAPFLDGTKTKEELTAGLDAGRAGMVDKLLDVLTEKGALTTAIGPAVDADHELADYRQQIGFIEHYGKNGAEGFVAFRDAVVQVVGDDAVSESVREGLLLNGLGRVAETGDDAEFIVVSATEGDAHRIVETLRDNPSATVLPVVRVGEKVMVGPLTGPRRLGDWNTVMSRFTRNDNTGEAARLWMSAAVPDQAVRPERLRAAHASLLGMMAAFEVFRDLTGALKAETDGAVIFVNLKTGDSAREEALVDPRDLTERSTVAPKDVADILDAGEPEEEPVDPTVHEHEHENLRRFMLLAGETVGIVTGFEDEEIDQAPIKIARTTVNAGSPDAAPALGFAYETAGHARLRSAANAILEYVRSLGPLPAGDVTASRRIEAAGLAIATGLGDGDDRGWVVGRSLDGDVVEVPAAAVYARSAVNDAGVFEHTSAGEGAGEDFAEALLAGVRSALAYDGVQALARGESLPEVTLAELDDAVTYLTRTATLLGHKVGVYRLPGAAPAIAVFAVIRGTQDYAVGVGKSVSAATADALVDLLGRTLTTGQTGPDLLLVPGLDPRSARFAPADGSTVEEPPLATALRAQGREAVVVDTTPADVLASGALRTVRVLLTRSR
ncbi:hypothetical protein FB566_4374 [Stackebrandtia endophytica]|uniref:YcaO domain-containing protein n=1 Tax=Stackebrandtia endophytica TaxID=1496996 RepID=A0A543B224_9ACTN|nr:hypothetical protein [Stackebrandtia endophytica]TQL78780.1 hypothetical protein FB566_4374 [Stackebrandtia endophytica]